MGISTEITDPLSVATTPEGSMQEADEVTAMLRPPRRQRGSRVSPGPHPCAPTRQAAGRTWGGPEGLTDRSEGYANTRRAS